MLVRDDNEHSQRLAEAAGFNRQPGRHTVARRGDNPGYIRFTSS